MRQGKIEKAIIAGAGPVGLLTALFLGQRGIPVDVVEMRSEVNTSPRGLAYGPAAVRWENLHVRGIDREITAVLFQRSSTSWYTRQGN